MALPAWISPVPLRTTSSRMLVRRLLLKKPGPDVVSDDYEPTEEELEQVYRVESVPSDTEL